MAGRGGRIPKNPTRMVKFSFLSEVEVSKPLDVGGHEILRCTQMRYQVPYLQILVDIKWLLNVASLLLVSIEHSPFMTRHFNWIFV